MRVDPHYISNLSAALNQSSSVEAALTNQLSSGLRVASLSDDPVAAAQNSMLSSAIANDDTFIHTASGQISLMQVADSTLGEVVSQLTTAVSLAVQAGNGTNNAANLAAIAQQLTGIRDQVLSLANTSYMGQSLFAGSQASAKTFTLDTSSTPATVTYIGDSSQRFVETPSGQKIQTNLIGSDVFGSGSSGVFGVLNQLISDLSGSTAPPSTTANAAALSAALGQVSAQRSLLGGSLSRMQATSSYAQTEEAQLKVQQGALISADPVSIATELKSAEVQRQALMSVMSSVGKNNLFDYL